MPESIRLFIISGEASGDLHGKNLLRELRREAAEKGKTIECKGVGGDGLESEGMKLVAHVNDTSFMGFSEVLKNLGKIRALFTKVKSAIDEFRPSAVILIDYPAFNLRMAEWMSRKSLRVFYYISPQVWAWKKRRVEIVRRTVERMFVILPFEKEFYNDLGMEVDFVGHPLLDEIAQRSFEPVQFRKEIGAENKPILALLPGSRRQEIEKKLPVMLAAASGFPDHIPVIAAAPGFTEEYFRPFIQHKNIRIVFSKTYDLLHASDLAIVTSGTATLETALFKVPEVVCYASNPVSVWLARKLISVPYISLVNLIMGRAVVKELIQGELKPENIRAELTRVMNGTEERKRLLQDYDVLAKMLGGPGASQKAASLILERLI